MRDSAAGLRDFCSSVLGVVELENNRTEWKGGPRIVKSRKAQLYSSTDSFIGRKERIEGINLCRSDCCIRASRRKVNILDMIKGTLTLPQVIDDPITFDVVWNHKGIVTCR